jgi:starch synthase
MQVLSVASEIYPLIKTGGLADVVGALPFALGKNGVKTKTLIPFYSSIADKLKNGVVLHNYPSLLGEKARLLAFEYQGLDIIALDAPSLFNRKGGPYIDEFGNDFADNWKRFAALSKAASDIAGGILKNFLPDIVHAHDWQGALSALYMKFGNERAKATPSIVTIHNIAFQGRYGANIFEGLELPTEAFGIDNLEYYGDLSFLKGGLAVCNYITTVSPTYSQEIVTQEFGMGLEGLIGARADYVSGILNGIDDNVWNPKTDKYIPETYDAKSLTARVKNRRKVEEAFGLKRARGPIFCVISRLTWQKGMDVLVDLCEAFTHIGVRLAILGTGEPHIENAIINASKRFKGKIGAYIGYDEGLSHILQAGCDGILIPSRFEPCGLTQLYGLKYGCVPIVARTGGLADTIIDANEAALNASLATGFQFNKVVAHDFYHAIARANQIYYDKKQWAQIQRNGMKADFSWEKSGKKYVDLYKKALKRF